MANPLFHEGSLSIKLSTISVELYIQSTDQGFDHEQNGVSLLIYVSLQLK